VLSFAGLDPTGGAGLLGDVATLTALGVHAAGVITLVSAQDLEGVQWWRALLPGELRSQAGPLLRGLPIRAVKVGAVGTAANAAAIAELVGQLPGAPVIVDPVLSSERGDAIGHAQLAIGLRNKLLARATLVTPNADEAYRLAGLQPHVPLEEVAAVLLRSGARAVLVTGVAADNDVLDCLWQRDDAKPIAWRTPRLPYAVHGSGCLLASAIAAGMAHGLGLVPAIERAREYSARTWNGAWSAGRGQRLPLRTL
jgi:hydroxymethylpyrimidine/phosphomethylpyrimidine kinase